MAFDPGSSGIILFGGSDTFRNDTWLWFVNEWVPESPPTSPSARVSPAMAYDTNAGALVLFGGYDGAYQSDTWKFSSLTWSLQTSTVTPPGRYDPSMASVDSGVRPLRWKQFVGVSRRHVYRLFPELRRLAAFRGLRRSRRYRRVRLCPQPGRGPRRQLHLRGGSSYTWEWDGKGWTVGTGLQRFHSAFAYDPVNQQVSRSTATSTTPLISGRTSRGTRT